MIPLLLFSSHVVLAAQPEESDETSQNVVMTVGASDWGTQGNLRASNKRRLTEDTNPQESDETSQNVVMTDYAKGATGWKLMMLNAHNVARCMVDVSPLTYDRGILEENALLAARHGSHLPLLSQGSHGENSWPRPNGPTLETGITVAYFAGWWEQYQNAAKRGFTGHFKIAVNPSHAKMGCAYHNTALMCHYGGGNNFRNKGPPLSQLMKCKKSFAECNALHGAGVDWSTYGNSFIKPKNNQNQPGCIGDAASASASAASETAAPVVI